jgi:hypothetical protein
MYKKFAEIESVLVACGGSVRASLTHIARKLPRTELIETVSGSARPFSRENVFEMASASALIKGGAKTSAAFAYAANFQTMIHFKEPFPEWFVFAAGDLRRAIHADSIDLAKVRRELADPVTLSIVNLHEIKKMVDDLYGAD